MLCSVHQFVTEWASSKEFERNLKHELEICKRRKSMLAFQVQKARHGFQVQQKVLPGPQCSPVDTMRLSKQTSDLETTASNISTHSNTPQKHKFKRVSQLLQLRFLPLVSQI